MICAILFAVTGGGTGWAENFPMFIGFRMLSGVAVGAAALVCPIYLAEISPAPMRGTTVSFYQLSIVIGILLAYPSNYLLLNVEDNWRWMFFVLGFIGIYSATLGPVTWVALSEIFPNRIRGNAMAVATLALWIANFFTTALFPVMNQYFGMPVTFLIHAAICLVYYFFIRTSVPETKGRSLEEIEKLLKNS